MAAICFEKGEKAMRKLLWFTLGFSAAAALCSYLFIGQWLWLFTLLVCALFLGVICFRKKIHPIIVVMTIGFFIGTLYYYGYDRALLSDAKNYDGATMPVEVTASDYSFSTDYGLAVDGKIYLNGRKYKTRLYFQGDYEIKPGDCIRIMAKLRYTPSGGLEISTYHKGEGIFLLAYGQNQPVLQYAEASQGRYSASYLRKWICSRMAEIFPRDTVAFAKALLIGDTSDIGFGENIYFQKSGIRHIIAVSGLHVSILFSIIHFVTRKNRFLVLIIGLPVLGVFSAVAGFSPSVVKACIMQALFVIAFVIDRDYDPGTALSFAALVMLMVNPLTITSVSFQLSVGCMVGIFLFSGSVREYFMGKIKHKDSKNWRSRVRKWFIGSLSVSISVMIFTLPLCAVYFDEITVMGVLTNLLVLWIIPFIFCGIIVACVVSLAWMPMGSVAAWVISWAIRYVQLISKAVAHIPGGTVYTDSPYTVLWIICTVVLVGIYLLCKKKSPMFLSATVAVLYALTLAASWAEPRLGDVQVTVLDVGQGQCVLLQSKNELYMVDCGGSDPKQTATVAINAMGAQGVSRLDGLILTHYDDDHCNGAAYLLEVIPTERLYLPYVDRGNETRQQLERMDIPIKCVTGNTTLRLSAGKLKIFPGISGQTDNESSLCILFQGKKCDILITGDRSISGEHMLLEQEDIPQLELLVAGHHGAATSTGPELLEKCSPAVVAISAGGDNFHGHPNSATLERLREAGCIVRRTDIEGTIIFRG